MKKTRKLLNIIIAIMLALSFMLTAVACGDDDEDDTAVKGSITKELVYEDGIHKGSNPEDTETNFIADGKTDYVLVTPKNATSRYPANAKLEFNILFEKATGFSMVTTTDDKVTYSENAKYISLGDTTLLDQAGIGKDSSGNVLHEYSYEYLTREGFKIITKGKSVFLYTVHEDGLFNAVHKFMEINFNYQYYYVNCMTIDSDVKNLKLKNFNVTEVPDVHRVGITGSNLNGLDQSTPVPVRPGDTEGLGPQASTEVQFKNMRYGIQVHANYWMQMNVHMRKNASDVKPYGGTNYYSNDIHNEFYWVDYFNADHLSAWYASDRLGKDKYDAPTASQMQKWVSTTTSDRICYTAGGDKDAYEAGIRHFANKLIYSLKAYNTVDYPNENVITFTMGDSGSTCMCNSCQSIYTQCNNAYSITTLLVCNDIMELVEPWLEEQKTNGDPYHAYREDFDLVFFAYNKLTAPPTIYDEATDTHQPCSVQGMLDDEPVPVKFHKNVGVYHAEGNTGGRFDGYLDVLSPRVEVGLQEIYGWEELFDENDKFKAFWTWYNSGNIYAAGYFSDPMTTYSKNYWTLKAIVGSDFVYAAHQHTTNYTSGYTSLFYFLMGELRWDCTQDAEQLTNDYFNAMYGPAAESMKALLTAMQDHWAWIVSSMDAQGSNPGRGQGINQNSKWWPYQATSKWLEFVDNAYEDIEYLKAENPTLYSAYNYRIKLEEACPLYTILRTYQFASQKPYSDAKEIELKQRLLDSVSWAGGMGIDNVAQ